MTHAAGSTIVTMVGKLVTRRSTLGASRDERIESAMEATSPLYGTRSQSTSRGKSGRNDRYATEFEDEAIRRSVRRNSQRYNRSPKVDHNTTSSSITTTSSMNPTHQQSPSKLGRTSKFRRQSSRDPTPSNRRRSASLTRQSSREPSPSNMRRSSSFRRQSSRDHLASNKRRSSSSLTRQYSVEPSLSNMTRSATVGRQASTNNRQSSLRSASPSPQSSRQSSRNLSAARSRHSSRSRSPARSRQYSRKRSSERSRHYSRTQSPVRPRSTSRQSSRNPYPARSRHNSNTSPRPILRHTQSFRRQSSRDQTLGLSSSGQASRKASRQASRQSPGTHSGRQVSRSRSRTRSRPKAGVDSFSSSVLGSGKNAPSDHYEEKIELVAMKNEKNQSFVRILVSKTSYKPKSGDGVEVVPNSERERSRSAKLAYRRGQGNGIEDALMSQEFSKHVNAGINKKQMTDDRLKDQQDEQNIKKYRRADTGTGATIDHTTVMDSIELPACDPMDIAATCIIACTEPIEPCRRTHTCSKSDYNAHNSSENRSPTQRIPYGSRWTEDERDDRNVAYETKA